MYPRVSRFVTNRAQMANYIAVEIAEHFRKLPTEEEIHFIEQALQQYLDLSQQINDKVMHF